MTAALFSVCLLLLTSAYAALPLEVTVPSGFTRLRSWANCSLYRVELLSSAYDNPPLLLHLVGSRYDIGYGYGYLLADEIQAAYWSLLESLLGDKFYDKVLIDVLGLALDWQWRDYLSQQLPTQYKSELEGVADGASDAGCSDCGLYSTRAIVLANAPGDIQDFILVLLREFSPNFLLDKAVGEPHRHAGMQCSMFAVWGGRTDQEMLFSGRNLDWNKDTGINKNKMVMVVVPDDGAIPSVTLGFVGLYGTLAGMSAKGLTVHEANLEENEITFSGFPWTLRLRYIMEYASDLQQGRDLWAATNNTVGFNHMIASGPDATSFSHGSKSQNVALALETMYQYTAYFADNDPREASAVYKYQNGSEAHIGFPMEEAVWRTNHGYDSVIREHFEWSQAPSSWSMQRYMFIHDALETYQLNGKKIGYLEAINITAIAGDKGSDPYTCQNNTDGTNVLSVTFQPQVNTVYVSWERSSGQSWRPAVCSTYIKLKMNEWFQTTPLY